MRLYLAFAVLMLAFLAYTEAQDRDPLEHFGGWFSDIVERAKDTFARVENSEFAINTRNFLREQYENVKSKFSEVTN